MKQSWKVISITKIITKQALLIGFDKMLAIDWRIIFIMQKA